MPTLNFTNGTSSPLLAVTRDKLYGFTRMEATDRDGRRCHAVKLADDGHTIIGDMSTVRFTEDGRAADEVFAVDADGQILPVLPSSFDAPVELNRAASVAELLNHRITAAYLLPELKPDGINIYAFPFNYRSGTNPKTAFLLSSNDRVFLLVGEPLNVVMLGHDDQPPQTDGDVDAEIDFSEM